VQAAAKGKAPTVVSPSLARCVAAILPSFFVGARVYLTRLSSNPDKCDLRPQQHPGLALLDAEKGSEASILYFVP